jgi:hypothetical protein
VAGANAVKINMLSPDTLVADQEYLATFAAGTADVVQKVARWAMLLFLTLDVYTAQGRWCRLQQKCLVLALHWVACMLLRAVLTRPRAHQPHIRLTRKVLIVPVPRIAAV